MNVEARGIRAWHRTPLRVLLLAVVTSAVAVACDPEGDDDDMQPRSLVIGGVPAPALALHDGSPVTDFLRYGDGLTFAVDSPGSVRVTRLVNATTSTLRVRSAMGLRQTSDTAYLTGRIIARWETYRGPSRFGAPVGVSYLWVKRSTTGVYTATLFNLSYVTGDTSRTLVYQRHSPFGPTPTPMSMGASEYCEDVSDAGDTSQVCCACGQGRNCTSNQQYPEF